MGAPPDGVVGALGGVVGAPPDGGVGVVTPDGGVVGSPPDGVVGAPPDGVVGEPGGVVGAPPDGGVGVVTPDGGVVTPPGGLLGTPLVVGGELGVGIGGAPLTVGAGGRVVTGDVFIGGVGGGVKPVGTVTPAGMLFCAAELSWLKSC